MGASLNWLLISILPNGVISPHQHRYYVLCTVLIGVFTYVAFYAPSGGSSEGNQTHTGSTSVVASPRVLLTSAFSPLEV